jgi:D-beta-D-heptose 7-phosphate kinase/D-beta-D-heptose 1-phosphate adenosyltransferase
MIKYCASLGDHLLIGIDSDERVKKAKGENRPINPESVRQQILLNFKWVNDVEIFSNDEELTNLVRSYSPDYMIVGSDWEGKHVIGSEYAKIVGFFERIDEFSTTEIIKRIAAG